jgi:hypothetical protein
MAQPWMRVWLAALAALVVVGAGAPLARAAEPGEELVMLMEQVATLVETNKRSCPAMATALGQFVDENKGHLKELSAAEKSLPAEERKAHAAKYKKRMMAASTKLTGGITACASNKKVREALGRFSAATK